MVRFYYGEDTFSLSRAVDVLRSEFKFVETMEIADETDTRLKNRLLEVMQSQGLFAEKKLVLLKNFLNVMNKFPESEKYLLGYNGQDEVVFVQDENCDKRLKFFKALQKIAQAKEFLIPAGRDLEKWIVSYLASSGFSMETAAMSEFIRLLGQNSDERLYDLWQVSSELEKLMLSGISAEKIIRLAEVEDLVKLNISQNIFVLTNLFAEGKGREASGLLEKIMAGNAASDLKTRTIQIIGGLASQIRSLLLVKDMEGENPAKIADMLGWKQGRVWINSKLAKKFTKEKLVRLLKDLRALDLRLKTSEEPPKLLLSLFLQKAKA